jgi:GxxExxY protein
MIHHEGTKGTKDTKVMGLGVSHAVVSAAIEVGAELDTKLRLDLLVNACLVVEVKSVDRLTPIHRAQVLTHLKLTNYSVGLLINFNVELLKHGIRRILLG